MLLLLKRLFTALPISYINVFSHRRVKIFHPFSRDYFFVMFLFLSFFPSSFFLSCRFIPWMCGMREEKKREWNQTVEKGVKYDNFADSLSLVSVILISRHNFWNCSIYFEVKYYDWNLWLAQGKSSRKMRSNTHEIVIYIVFAMHILQWM